MEDPLSCQLIIIAVLLVFSALFSASETAFTSLSIANRKAIEELKTRASKRTIWLVRKPDLLLTTILVGNNIVNIFASSLATTYVQARFGNPYITAGTLILTVVILIFGEITPKQIALRYNVGIALAMSGPIRVISVVLYPLIISFRFVSKGITRLVCGKAKSKQTSVESILQIVDVAEDEGVVDSYEQDLVQRVLHFSEDTVKAIMTHRTEVFSLPKDMLLKEAYPLIVDSKYSRVPVYDKDKENIVGILLVRHLMKASVEGRLLKPVSSLMVKPLFVPESLHVNDMFEEFRETKLQIAIVLDEYGGLAGVVTMEDVVEQLFGEIYDEHETGAAERVEETHEGTFTVQCDMSFQQFLDQFNIRYTPEEKLNTLAAFLLEEYGSIPKEGDVIQTAFGVFKITLMKAMRVEEAEFSPVEEEED